MAEFRLEIRGVNRVANKFRRLATFHPDVTNPVIRKWTQEKAAELRATAYPPERPNQVYKRTGRLGRSWRMRNPSPGKAQIINVAKARRGGEYASFVVGDAKGKGQAWMHENRWWIARKIIEESTPTLTQTLTKALQKEVRRG